MNFWNVVIVISLAIGVYNFWKNKDAPTSKQFKEMNKTIKNNKEILRNSTP